MAIREKVLLALAALAIAVVLAWGLSHVPGVHLGPIHVHSQPI